jgi:hypothetical protein
MCIVTEGLHMPAPIMPVVWTVARVGALAAVAVYVNKRRVSQPKHVFREAALDDVPEGLDVSSHRAEGETAVNGTGRWRRVVRFPNGSGLEVDASMLGRIRFRKID